MTGWRETGRQLLRIMHETGYRYDGTVTASYNEARMTPQTDPWQLTVDARVVTDPPAKVRPYWDYWGTMVSAFDLTGSHDELIVRATSMVETGPRPAPGPGLDWSALAADAVQDTWAELLRPTPYTVSDAELAELALDIRSVSRRPRDAVEQVVERVRHHLEYQPGVTGVHTSGVEAWQAGRGVCQDYAHVSLALLRAIGIPTRYVSGYLHPSVDPEPDVTVTGESHAWIEAWTGDWWPFDPTNGFTVGANHVRIGHGRDYHDVSPLRGIYSGAAGPGALRVCVEITPMGRPSPTAPATR